MLDLHSFIVPISLSSSGRPLTTASANDDQRSHGSRRSSKPDISDSQDSVEKCPLCCMIFPTAMALNDRARHINEHYAEDDNIN